MLTHASSQELHYPSGTSTIYAQGSSKTHGDFSEVTVHFMAKQLTALRSSHFVTTSLKENNFPLITVTVFTSFAVHVI